MPKIEDVAKKAGVSVTTVSRVLNNRGYISRATLDKVNQAMKELNYHPNETARSLFRKKSYMIGLIIPTVAHPFFGELAHYLEYYADQRGYKMILCNSNRDVSKERKYIDMLKKNQVDAVIMGSMVLDVEHYRNLNLPVVAFDRVVDDNTPVVTSDNLLGGKLASRLLIGKGCRKLVYMQGGIGGEHHNDLLAGGRYLGFVEELQNIGIEHFTLNLEGHDLDNRPGEERIVRFLQEHPEVDGVFASSDMIASIVIQACRRLDKRIPEEMKIIGYDDVRVASLLAPRLTTIRQPIQEMSELTIDLIIKQIEGEKVPVVNSLPVTLIERSTT